MSHPVQKCSRQTIRPLLASVLVRPRTLSKGVAKVLEEFDVFSKETPILNKKGQFVLDFSSCDYTKLNQHRFPALAPIARDIMGIYSMFISKKWDADVRPTKLYIDIDATYLRQVERASTKLRDDFHNQCETTLTIT